MTDAERAAEFCKKNADLMHVDGPSMRIEVAALIARVREEATALMRFTPCPSHPKGGWTCSVCADEEKEIA